MKTAKQIKQEITNEQGHLKMPPLTFFICLVISALLWIFVSLSQEYTVTYDYKVTFEDFPQEKSKAVAAPDTIRLTFKAKGFALLAPAYWESNRTLKLSVNKLVNYNKASNLDRYQFTQMELTDYLKEYGKLGEEFVCVESPPMTLELSQ